MAVSTRNRLLAEVTDVVKGEAAAKVSLRVGDVPMVTLITRDSADELGLAPGRPAGNSLDKGYKRHANDRRKLSLSHGWSGGRLTGRWLARHDEQ